VKTKKVFGSMVLDFDAGNQVSTKRGSEEAMIALARQDAPD